MDIPKHSRAGFNRCVCPKISNSYYGGATRTYANDSEMVSTTPSLTALLNTALHVIVTESYCTIIKVTEGLGRKGNSIN